MTSYILKRLLLMIPTLLGVLVITFGVIQFVPGGPVEQMVAQLQGAIRVASGPRPAAPATAAARASTRNASRTSASSTASTSPPTSACGPC